MGYGEAIREARKSKGLTQEELATTLGVTRQTIIYWEHEEVRPSDTMKAALCKELGTDFQSFFIGL